MELENFHIKFIWTEVGIEYCKYYKNILYLKYNIFKMLKKGNESISLCVFTDEQDYLDEWINYHRKIGIDHFYIYDSGDNLNISGYDITLIKYPAISVHTQMESYINCFNNFKKNHKWMGFIDVDEFYMSTSMNIKEDFKFIYSNGVALYWRMYGSNPYFNERQPIELYTQWFEDYHVKCFIKTNTNILKFINPHQPIIKGKIVNELNKPLINFDLNRNHSSEKMWLKHTWTRSLSEWQKKISRKGWYEFYNRKEEEFYSYNLKCLNT